MALHRNLTVHCVKCIFTKTSNKLKPVGKLQEYESLVAAEDLFGNKHTLDKDWSLIESPAGKYHIVKSLK